MSPPDETRRGAKTTRTRKLSSRTATTKRSAVLTAPAVGTDAPPTTSPPTPTPAKAALYSVSRNRVPDPHEHAGLIDRLPPPPAPRRRRPEDTIRDQAGPARAWRVEFHREGVSISCGEQRLTLPEEEARRVADHILQVLGGPTRKR